MTLFILAISLEVPLLVVPVLYSTILQQVFICKVALPDQLVL